MKYFDDLLDVPTNEDAIDDLSHGKRMEITIRLTEGLQHLSESKNWVHFYLLHTYPVYGLTFNPNMCAVGSRRCRFEDCITVYFFCVC